MRRERKGENEKKRLVWLNRRISLGVVTPPRKKFGNIMNLSVIQEKRGVIGGGGGGGELHSHVEERCGCVGGRSGIEVVVVDNGFRVDT